MYVSIKNLVHANCDWVNVSKIHGTDRSAPVSQFSSVVKGETDYLKHPHRGKVLGTRPTWLTQDVPCQNLGPPTSHSPLRRDVGVRVGVGDLSNGPGLPLIWLTFDLVYLWISLAVAKGCR